MAKYDDAPPNGGGDNTNGDADADLGIDTPNAQEPVLGEGPQVSVLATLLRPAESFTARKSGNTVVSGSIQVNGAAQAGMPAIWKIVAFSSDPEAQAALKALPERALAHVYGSLSINRWTDAENNERQDFQIVVKGVHRLQVTRMADPRDDRSAQGAPAVCGHSRRVMRRCRFETTPRLARCGFSPRSNSMLRMTKAERTQAETTIAMTLRGAINGSSKAAADAAIESLNEADTYSDLAEELWARIAQAVLDAGIAYGGPLAEHDRERLIEEICKRLATALRAPVDKD
jgi:hypothetical protein